MNGDFVAIIGLIILTGVMNWAILKLRSRVEALERAVRELNPGLDI